MNRYYVLEQDELMPYLPRLSRFPEGVRERDFIQGEKVEDVPEPLSVELVEYYAALFSPDIITFDATLVSQAVKEVLDRSGADNIDYYKVILTKPKTKEIVMMYWLVNVIGLLKCVDLNLSKGYYSKAEDSYEFTEFSIDPELAPGEAHIFRIAEDRRHLIVMTEHLANPLRHAGLKGVRIVETTKYKTTVLDKYLQGQLDKNSPPNPNYWLQAISKKPK